MQEGEHFTKSTSPYLAELATRGTNLPELMRLKLNNAHAAHITLRKDNFQTTISRNNARKILSNGGGEELAKWFLAVDALTQNDSRTNYRAVFIEEYVQICTELRDVSIKAQAEALGINAKKMGWIINGINTQLAFSDMAQTIEPPQEFYPWLEYVQLNLAGQENLTHTWLEKKFLETAINYGVNRRTVNSYARRSGMSLDTSVVNAWIELMLCKPKHIFKHYE